MVTDRTWYQSLSLAAAAQRDLEDGLWSFMTPIEMEGGHQ